jgi:TetR/AcrR family fatty acid metabolism transcriptional regulator
MNKSKEPKLPPRDPGRKREQILQAALEVFARHGFYQSRVSEIARQAGVADGTIYLYFQSKDDILISLFEHVMSRVLDNMERAMEKETDPVRKLEQFALTHLNLIEEKMELAEIIQVEIRQSSKFMKEYDNRKFAQYLNLIASIIEEGQEKGIFRREIVPGVAKRAFFGALDEMSRFWVLSSRKKYTVATAARQISDIFIRGISASPLPQAEPITRPA